MSMKPIRIQRKRTKGWRMPENTIYVGRASKWGNPFKPQEGGKKGAVSAYRAWLNDEYLPTELEYRHIPTTEEIRSKLRGKNLACWCAESEYCHAVVLLEIANSIPKRTQTKK